MNFVVSKTLANISHTHGHKLFDKPWLTEGLLRDLCPGHDGAVNVLVAAQREGVPQEIQGWQNDVPLDFIQRHLVERIRRNCFFSENAAIWAVESWIKALLTDEIEMTGELLNIKEAVGEVVVSKHGGGNFSSISDALAQVTDGIRLRIMEGVYDEHIVLKHNVEIVGDSHPENTIIKGLSGIVLHKYGGRVSLGNLCIEEYNESDFIDVSAGEIIMNEVIIRSRIFVHGYRARIELHDCRFESKGNDCLIFGDNSKGLLDHVTVHGAIIIREFSHPAMIDCSFDNSLNCSDFGRGMFERCTINAHVIVTSNAKSIFRNCTFRSKHKNGITVTQGVCSLFSCALEENAVVAGGNAVLNIIESNISGKIDCGITIRNNARCFFENCIIHGFQYSGIAVHQDASVKMIRCIVKDMKRNGISVLGSRPLTIKSSEIRHCNNAGIEIFSHSPLRCFDCHIHQNSKGITMNHIKQGIFFNCDITENVNNIVITKKRINANTSVP